MPNRDHDDTPYNRNEGRFESPRSGRDEERSPYQREQSYRSSRDWDRDSFGSGSRAYAEGYNPARDDNDYRGGSRFEDRGRYQSYDGNRGYEGNRGFESNRGYDTSRGYDTRAWDDDERWRERLRGGGDWDREQRGSYASQGSYGRGQAGGYGQGNFGGQSGGYGQGGYGQGNFGSGYGQGSFGRGESSGQLGRGTFGRQSGQSYGGQDASREYTRDWDRDYRGDWDRRSNQSTRSQDEGDFGDQLREAGRNFMGKVKRVFRGPKGYKRSDERIREDVNDRLAQQDEIDPSDIEVRVENGDVTLTGSVRSRHEKFRAEEIADDVSGVNDVHNQLRIGSVQTGQTLSTGVSASTSSTSVSRNGRA